MSFPHKRTLMISALSELYLNAMIILKDYGIELVQLTKDKIELVRRWRTDPKISQYMEYKGEITPEMQKAWFKRITETHKNLYFLIVYKNTEVGVINIRNIDWNLRTGESGIFLWDDNLKGSGIAVKAGYCLYDFIFNDLYFNKITAKIYNTNTVSQKYHQKFGFELEKSEVPNTTGCINQLYLLNRQTYMNKKGNNSNALNISVLGGGKSLVAYSLAA